MAEQLNQIVKILKLDVLDRNQSLKIVKQKTGINPSIVALALGVFLCVSLMISSAASTFVVAIACYLIPAYFTFVELESHQRENDIRFLTYWIVFATLEILSPILSWIITSGFYTLARIALAVTSIHPAVNLSGKIYHQTFEPFLLKNQSQIDRNIEKVDKIIGQKTKKIGEAIGQFSKEA